MPTISELYLKKQIYNQVRSNDTDNVTNADNVTNVAYKLQTSNKLQIRVQNYII